MDFHSKRLQQLNEDIGTMTFTINGLNQLVPPEESLNQSVSPVGSEALSEMLGSPLTSSYATKILRLTSSMAGFYCKASDLADNSTDEDDGSKISKLVSTHLKLMYGRLDVFLDFGGYTELRLSCFSQASSMIIFCPNIRQCPRVEQIATMFVGQCEHIEMLLMVHGPPLLQRYKIEI